MRKLALMCAVLGTLILSACGGSETLGGTDPNDPDSVYKAGSLGSGSFQNGALAIGETNLASGGSTSLSVDIVDDDNQFAFGVPATVGFSSTCLARGLSEVDVAQGSTSTGSFTATYTATGCSGSDTVTAFVTIDGTTLTARGTVNVQPAELGGLEFISATPAVIGMTGSPLPSQSAVLFRLTDSNGAVLPNRSVDFTLNSSVGGIMLSPTTATSDASGIVRTTVQAGSVHTTVRVRAATTNPTSGLTISSQSGQLVITTGLPDQDSFSISATSFAIDGGCDGEETGINIRAADRYNNPVPAGTAISFTAEGGKINGQCLTTGGFENPGEESGVCSVLLTVQNPRPANGRVTVLATALGEESFTDTNGNGFHDAAEPFTDLPEAFVDFDEDGVRDSIEPILDFNGNGAYDAANGDFDGYVCDQPGVNCQSNLVDIRESLVIVFSNTAQPPVITPLLGIAGDTISVPANGAVNVSALITDVNENSLPSGTTYTLTTTAGTVLEPVTVGPFSTTDGDTASFRIQAPAAATTGTVTLTITIPDGTCFGVRKYSRNYTLNVT